MEESKGFLRIKVSSAGGALPVEGATVLVYGDRADGEGGETLASMRTDSSGITPTLTVLTPPASLSRVPGFRKPYSTVNIRIEKDGYYPVENVGVPIFDGTLSEQNVNLIPRSGTGEYPDEGLTVIENPQKGTVYNGGDE